MPFLRFGRKNYYSGCSLWAIVLTQSRQAVGRLVIQNHLKHFPQPSFMRLKEVNAIMDENRKMHGKIIAERWHRGHYVGLEDVTCIAKFTNYSLVEKTEEEKLWKELETCKQPDVVVLPSSVAMPPVFKLFLEQQHNMSADRYPLHLRPDLPDNFWLRVAGEGEESTVPHEEVDGLGTTSQLHLYEGVPLEKSTHAPPKNSIRIPTIDISRIHEQPVKITEESVLKTEQINNM